MQEPLEQEMLADTAADTAVPQDGRFDEPPAPPVLDLDALEVVRVSVTLGGEVYYMKNKQDMAMVDREELRLCMMQIADLQEAEPGKDGQHTTGHKKALDDLERRLVALALPDLPRKILNDDTVLTPARRNAVIERFFVEVDAMGTVQSFVATMRRLSRQSTGTPPRAPLSVLKSSSPSETPPLPPVDLLGRRPSSTTTPSATPTPS